MYCFFNVDIAFFLFVSALEHVNVLIVRYIYPVYKQINE